jgi:hypothetical protein
MTDYRAISDVSTSVVRMLDQALPRSSLNTRAPLDDLSEAALAGLTLTVTPYEIGSLGPGTLEAAIRSVARK